MTDRIQNAARWLAATPPAERPHPIIPHLRADFGLSAREAVDAIRIANKLREAC